MDSCNTVLKGISVYLFLAGIFPKRRFIFDHIEEEKTECNEEKVIQKYKTGASHYCTCLAQIGNGNIFTHKNTWEVFPNRAPTL